MLNESLMNTNSKQNFHSLYVYRQHIHIHSCISVEILLSLLIKTLRKAMLDIILFCIIDFKTKTTKRSLGPGS